jgi:hypothetical protein
MWVIIAPDPTARSNMVVGMLAAFDGTWDWTAIGTLALAAATFVSLYFARRSLAQTQQQIKLGQEQLEQTQREIELSRREVEEAHRPVLVPFQRSVAVRFRGGEIPAGGGPKVSGNDPGRQDQPRYSVAFLPVENVGMGPALNVRGEFTGPRGIGTTRFPTEAVAAGAHGVVTFENWDGDSMEFTGNDPPVTAVVDYDDVAGRTHRTTVVFDIRHSAYRSTFGGD